MATYVRWSMPSDVRKAKLVSPRGYIKREAYQPDLVPFVTYRRGPKRPVMDSIDVQVQMAEYARDQGIATASLPELLVHFALTSRGLRDGLTFDFQSSQLGGRLELGGMVVDFLFLDRPIALRVQGEYFHHSWERMGQGAHDEQQRIYLEHLGYTVLDLWESTIMDADLLDDWMARNIDVFVARSP